jgi:sec-independent protein translocase protein TatA
MNLAFGFAWGPGQIILVLIIILLLFGRGKISELMGDMAKGIKSFKKGLSEEEETRADIAKSLEQAAQKPDPAVRPTETKVS